MKKIKIKKKRLLRAYRVIKYFILFLRIKEKAYLYEAEHNFTARDLRYSDKINRTSKKSVNQEKATTVLSGNVI